MPAQKSRRSNCANWPVPGPGPAQAIDGSNVQLPHRCKKVSAPPGICLCLLSLTLRRGVFLVCLSYHKHTSDTYAHLQIQIQIQTQIQIQGERLAHLSADAYLLIVAPREKERKRESGSGASVWMPRSICETRSLASRDSKHPRSEPSHSLERNDRARLSRPPSCPTSYPTN